MGQKNEAADSLQLPTTSNPVTERPVSEGCFYYQPRLPVSVFLEAEMSKIKTQSDALKLVDSIHLRISHQQQLLRMLAAVAELCHDDDRRDVYLMNEIMGGLAALAATMQDEHEAINQDVVTLSHLPAIEASHPLDGIDNHQSGGVQ